jgi:hypothetical protein
MHRRSIISRHPGAEEKMQQLPPEMRVDLNTFRNACLVIVFGPRAPDSELQNRSKG